MVRGSFVAERGEFGSGGGRVGCADAFEESQRMAKVGFGGVEVSEAAGASGDAEQGGALLERTGGLVGELEGVVVPAEGLFGVSAVEQHLAGGVEDLGEGAVLTDAGGGGQGGGKGVLGCVVVAGRRLDQGEFAVDGGPRDTAVAELVHQLSGVSLGLLGGGEVAGESSRNPEPVVRPGIVVKVPLSGRVAMCCSIVRLAVV
jgi:hypothetical protein